MANLLQVFLLKEKSFPISIVRMLYKYLNLPSSIFSSATGVEILCIAKVNNANSCYSSVKLLIFRMSKEKLSKKYELGQFTKVPTGDCLVCLHLSDVSLL